MEVLADCKLWHARAEAPNTEALDAKAMYYEQKKFKNCSTPSELYHALPVLAPTLVEGFLDEVDAAKGSFKLRDPRWFQELPFFSWDYIWTFATAKGQV